MQNYSFQLVKNNGDIQFIDVLQDEGILQFGGANSNSNVVISGVPPQNICAVIDAGLTPASILCVDGSTVVQVNGVPIAIGDTQSISEADHLQIGDYTVLLLAGQPVLGVPSPSVSAQNNESAPVTPETLPIPEFVPDPNGPDAQISFPLQDALTGDEISSTIILGLDERELETAVEGFATFQLTITNGGPRVGTFNIAVDGLPEQWVTIDQPSINLYERESQSLQITVVPPRHFSSKAGDHFFKFTVSSPDYPNEVAALAATLRIDPFTAFTLDDLSPRDLTIRYLQRKRKLKCELMNRSNVATDFLIKASDTANAMQLTFQTPDNMAYSSQAEWRLEPGERQSFQLTTQPHKRRLIALRPQRYSLNVEASIVNGLEPPAMRIGQLITTPLIGPWLLLTLLVCMLMLLVYSLRPRMTELDVVAAGFDSSNTTTTSFSDPPIIEVANGLLGNESTVPNEIIERTIAGGESVEINWRTSAFTTLSIDEDVGEQGTSGGTLKLSPQDTTTYHITARNFISDLMPRLFSFERTLKVTVEPVKPVIRLEVDRADILVGEAVSVRWNVANADEVFLVLNGAAETIPDSLHVSNRQITLKEDTDIVIKAINHYTGAQGETKLVQVFVSTPTPTPIPPAVFRNFSVQPETITVGEAVTLSWSVEGVDKVTIDPLGDLPATGQVEHKPKEDTVYILKATNGQEPITPQEVTVDVQLPPTPTLVPGAPSIDFFKISPDTVEKGTADAKKVQLAWSITPEHRGDDITVEISGGALGLRRNLPLQGTLTFEADASAEYVLTAANGALKSTHKVELTVTVPAPVITSVNPDLSTDVGAATLTVTVNGSNFVRGAKVQVNGQDRPTTYQSSSRLSVKLLATDIAKAADIQIGVVNPVSSGGAKSNNLVVKLQHPAPVLSSVSPADMTLVTVNPTDITVTLSGSGFVPGSVAAINGTPAQTTVVSTSQLSVKIPAASVGTAATLSFTVTNPAPGGGTSVGVDFLVKNPVPSVTSFTPTTSVAGVGPVAVKVFGQNFVPSSTVRFNGQPVITTYSGPSELEIQLLAEQLVYIPQGHIISVNNPDPGGGSADTTGISPSTYTVSQVTTTTTLAFVPNSSIAPQIVGQPFSITATVAAQNSSQIPAGQAILTFANVDNQSTLTADLVDGVATFTFANGIPDTNFDVSGQYVPSVNPATFAESTTTTALTVTQKPAYVKTIVEYSTDGTNYTQATLVQNVGATFINTSSGTVDASAIQTLFLRATGSAYAESSLLNPLTTVPFLEGAYEFSRTDFSTGTAPIATFAEQGAFTSASSSPVSSSSTANHSYLLSQPSWRLGPNAIRTKYTAVTTNPLFNSSTANDDFILIVEDTPDFTVQWGGFHTEFIFDTDCLCNLPKYYSRLDIDIQHHTKTPLHGTATDKLFGDTTKPLDGGVIKLSWADSATGTFSTPANISTFIDPNMDYVDGRYCNWTTNATLGTARLSCWLEITGTGIPNVGKDAAYNATAKHGYYVKVDYENNSNYGQYFNNTTSDAYRWGN